MSKKVINSRYDLTGMEITRLWKLFFLSKFVPIGYFGNGPGIRPLMTLTFYHFFSRPLLWLALRYERQFHGFFVWVEKRRKQAANRS